MGRRRGNINHGIFEHSIRSFIALERNAELERRVLLETPPAAPVRRRRQTVALRAQDEPSRAQDEPPRADGPIIIEQRQAAAQITRRRQTTVPNAVCPTFRDFLNQLQRNRDVVQAGPSQNRSSFFSRGRRPSSHLGAQSTEPTGASATPAAQAEPTEPMNGTYFRRAI